MTIQVGHTPPKRSWLGRTEAGATTKTHPECLGGLRWWWWWLQRSVIDVSCALSRVIYLCGSTGLHASQCVLLSHVLPSRALLPQHGKMSGLMFLKSSSEPAEPEFEHRCDWQELNVWSGSRCVPEGSSSRSPWG